MDKQERPVDLAQLLALIKDAYDVTETEIARRIGVAPATVNAWVHRKRGTGRGPNPDKLRALAAAFPRYSEDTVFRAAGRKSPGPLSSDAEARIIELWRGLTEEQQRAKEVELRALNEMNRTGQ
ncbi:XRE family transcriptional regulator [Streptomyces leeuwenhoekii]|uniref:XRE family transcriptional regulator n=1 Tax=Streptomyces leeuwenhoekii TaxID=1437453 RepID=UPI0036F85BD8